MTAPEPVGYAAASRERLDLSGAELRPDNPYLEVFAEPSLRLLRWVLGEKYPRVVSLGAEESLCLCDGFHPWYATDEIWVCWCGHHTGEHLDKVGSCTGVVEILPAGQP